MDGQAARRREIGLSVTIGEEASLESLALVARLSAGLEHRLNNLSTVLMISAQQLGELPGVPGDEPRELREILNGAIDELSLLGELLCSRNTPVNASRAARAVTSAISGLDHRVAVQTTASTDEPAEGKAAHTPVVRALVALALAGHRALPDGGRITVAVASGPTVVLRCSGPQVLAPSALDRRGSRDLELAEELARSAGASLSIGREDDELVLSLRV